jgi:hypothetical protein
MKVILGVYGDSLADSVFLRPSGHSALMEFFPSDVFTRDAETAVRSLGINYIAWWNDRYALPLPLFSDASFHPFIGGSKMTVFHLLLQGVTLLKKFGSTLLQSCMLSWKWSHACRDY